MLITKNVGAGIEKTLLIGRDIKERGCVKMQINNLTTFNL